jgi:hypothetical protein
LIRLKKLIPVGYGRLTAVLSGAMVYLVLKESFGRHTDFLIFTTVKNTQEKC